MLRRQDERPQSAYIQFLLLLSVCRRIGVVTLRPGYPYSAGTGHNSDRPETEISDELGPEQIEVSLHPEDSALAAIVA